VLEFRCYSHFNAWATALKQTINCSIKSDLKELCVGAIVLCLWTHQFIFTNSCTLQRIVNQASIDHCILSLFIAYNKTVLLAIPLFYNWLSHSILGAFAYIDPHVCASVCPRTSAKLPLDGFSWNLMLRTFMKICQETINVVKIEQKHRSLYVKT
jgi:hypothetical protein